MRKPIVGLILGAMATLGFLPASAQSAQVLTSAQIVEVFVGKTIKQVDDRYWAFYEPGGKLGGLYVNDEDQGRWGFSGNRLCQRWDRWNANQPNCFYVLKGLEGAYRLDDGAGNGFNVTVRAGNPMGLL